MTDCTWRIEYLEGEGEGEEEGRGEERRRVKDLSVRDWLGVPFHRRPLGYHSDNRYICRH